MAHTLLVRRYRNIVPRAQKQEFSMYKTYGKTKLTRLSKKEETNLRYLNLFNFNLCTFHYRLQTK